MPHWLFIRDPLAPVEHDQLHVRVAAPRFVTLKHGRERIEVALGEELHVFSRDAAISGARYAVDGFAQHHRHPMRRSLGNGEKESSCGRAGSKFMARTLWDLEECRGSKV